MMHKGQSALRRGREKERAGLEEQRLWQEKDEARWAAREHGNVKEQFFFALKHFA